MLPAAAIATTSSRHGSRRHFGTSTDLLLISIIAHTAQKQREEKGYQDDDDNDDGDEGEGSVRTMTPTKGKLI